MQLKIVGEIVTVKVMKVSSKGQVTLPREIRRVLGSDVVMCDLKDGRVLLLPVPDVGGSLKEYAGKPPLPFHRAREKAWEAAAREKASRSGKLDIVDCLVVARARRENREPFSFDRELLKEFGDSQTQIKQ